MPTHVKTNGHPIAILLDDRSGPIRVLQGRGADVHTRSTGLQCSIQRIIITNATGQFDIDPVTKFVNDFTQLTAVVARAKCGIEIHQMNPFGTGLGPSACRLERRTVIRFRTGFTLAQAHGLAIAHINSGEKSQRHQRTTFLMNYSVAIQFFSN